MLVLTRKATQALQIAGGITVTVLEVNEFTVKLGIVAPPETKILRSELIEFESHDRPQTETSFGPAYQGEETNA